jgi:alkylation response protein AidB-like acyl-CoA dehydrogenase
MEHRKMTSRPNDFDRFLARDARRFHIFVGTSQIHQFIIAREMINGAQDSAGT